MWVELSDTLRHLNYDKDQRVKLGTTLARGHRGKLV